MKNKFNTRKSCNVHQIKYTGMKLYFEACKEAGFFLIDLTTTN